MLDLICGCLEIVLFIDVRLLAVILGYMAIFCAQVAFIYEFLCYGRLVSAH
jgi:hypothetical protein